MSLHRAKGWLPEVLKASHVRFSQLFGQQPVPALFPKADLRDFRGPRYHQGPLSSCVPHAIKRAVRVCDGIAARMLDPQPKIDDASARFLFWIARLQPFAGLDPATIPPPTDVGVYPSVAFDAVKRQGFCRETDCPYDLSHPGPDGKPLWTNQMPAPSAFQAAIDQRGLDYYAIEGAGDDRIQGVRDALRAGFAVVHGIQVDRHFEDYAGVGRVESLDPNEFVGGHMMATLAVEDDGTVIDDNWWDDWGYDDGTGAIAPDVYGGPYVSNVFAVRTVPIFSARAT